MLRPTLFLLLLLGLALPAGAQSGTVRYDQSTRLDFNLPPNSPMAGRLPRSTVRPMVLTYSAELALFAPAPRDASEDAERMATMRNREVMVISRDGPPMPVTMGAVRIFGGPPGFGGSRGGTLNGAWTNLVDGSFVEVREFLGRTFRIPEQRPEFAWRLTGEQATFQGYPVYQAVAEQDSSSIEAWFTPEIPIAAGPAEYGGLPGLILTLTVDSNRVSYTATVIDTTADVGELKAPTDGSEVSRAEYDRIVEEKTAEMARMRRGRNN